MPIDKNTLVVLNNNLDIVKTKLQNSGINQVFFNEYISNISVIDIKENILYIKTKNIFAKQTLNTDYKNQIQKLFNEINKSNYSLEFIVENDLNLKFKTNPIQHETIREDNNTNINKRYKFTNFVVSNFNKSAYNAIRTILTDTCWNQIFITGGVGLGKTHLLHAIGNEYKVRFPNKIVKYIPIDDFIREVYNAFSIGGNSVELLKQKYESYDLLLFDDVQFLEKKEKINEIFFNIFNKATANDKIIIMTCDKDISQLKNLENRMKSRFSSGLVVKITKPDLKSVKTILENKLKESNTKIVLTNDVINYICGRYSTDIRQLEGFLHHILFYCINNDLPPNAIINLDLIKKITMEENNESINKFGFDVDPNLIIDQVCSLYFVDPEIIKSKDRTKQVTQIRQVCMYILRKKFNMNYAQIGSFFSGRDHSTVMESIEKIEKKVKSDVEFENFLTNLYKKI